jgi:hypothetical protein
MEIASLSLRLAAENWGRFSENMYERGFQHMTVHPCEAVSHVLRAASTAFFHSNRYYSSNSSATYSSYSFLILIMGYVKRKTARKEHKTPRRTRFRCLIDQGFSQRDAATK